MSVVRAVSSRSDSGSGLAATADRRSRACCAPVLVLTSETASPRRMEVARASSRAWICAALSGAREATGLALACGAAGCLAGPEPPQPARASAAAATAAESGPMRPDCPPSRRTGEAMVSRFPRVPFIRRVSWWIGLRERSNERRPGKGVRFAAGEPAQDGGADVAERPVVAAVLVAGEAGEQRRVLAGVVGAGGGRVAAVVGREDQEIPLRVETLQPPADLGVDALQGAVEARDVPTVAVHLVRLHEVREHEALVELVDELRGRLHGDRVRRALVLVVDADAVEHLPDLADGVDG